MRAVELRDRMKRSGSKHPRHIEEAPMGTDDKIDNKMEELGGKAKEGVGRATGDEELQAQGEGDQAKSNLKQAGENIKDAFKG
jgi:uncharacterized protein YjbJ (UPF0337 family)